MRFAADNLYKQTSNQTASQRPGVILEPTSFASFYENENKTAAYLGFEHTSALRRLAVSYPVLDAFIAFDPISSNARVHSSLALLADDEKEFTDVQEPEKKWPIETNDKGSLYSSYKKAARIASILVKSKQSLSSMPTLSTDVNQTFQEEAHKTFCQSYPTITVVNIQHGPPIFSETQLGPLPLESTIEPFNRFYTLLKYFQRQVRTEKNLKNLRNAQGLAKGSPVKPDNIPAWMRSQTPDAEVIPINKTVSLADKLSKKSFAVFWYTKFDHEDLKATLDEKEDLVLPDSKQIFTTDPRLFRTSMGFRDQIRRQSRASELHTDIHRCRLEYQFDDSEATADALTGKWKDFQKLLDSDENFDFVFKVGFFPLDEDEPFNFESDEDPNLEGF
jgi:hypothetical protein